jgi:AcrR family transcriptional regulator
MEPVRREVKSARRYDAAGRRHRAQQQHTAALETARRMFVEHGYRASTVDAIADATGVSPSTIYKSYGGKAGLIRELCHRALAGAGPVPAEDRSNLLRTSEDPRQVFEGWGLLTAEVSPRVSPLLLLLRVAAHDDAEAAELYEELDRARLARMTDNARELAERGHLRPGVTVDDARDVLWLCSSPDLYELLVIRRGWPLPRFARFVSDTMTGALL